MAIFIDEVEKKGNDGWDLEMQWITSIHVAMAAKFQSC